MQSSPLPPPLPPPLLLPLQSLLPGLMSYYSLVVSIAVVALAVHIPLHPLCHPHYNGTHSMSFVASSLLLLLLLFFVLSIHLTIPLLLLPPFSVTLCIISVCWPWYLISSLYYTCTTLIFRPTSTVFPIVLNIANVHHLCSILWMSTILFSTYQHCIPGYACSISCCQCPPPLSWLTNTTCFLWFVLFPPCYSIHAGYLIFDMPILSHLGLILPHHFPCACLASYCQCPLLSLVSCVSYKE